MIRNHEKEASRHAETLNEWNELAIVGIKFHALTSAFHSSSGSSVLFSLLRRSGGAGRWRQTDGSLFLVTASLTLIAFWRLTGVSC